MFLDIDNCESRPCQNGGACYDNIASRTCFCVKGFTGESCEINEGNCNPNPCSNGCSCIYGWDSYTCDCTDKWIGDRCDWFYDAKKMERDEG